jgi:hypothetical protein
VPIQARILKVGSVRLPTGLGGDRLMVSLTYSADGAFPRIAYVDAERDSPEERRRVIAEDLERARAEAPQSVELP